MPTIARPAPSAPCRSLTANNLPTTRALWVCPDDLAEADGSRTEGTEEGKPMEVMESMEGGAPRGTHWGL
jgi:hypothetical protein